MTEIRQVQVIPSQIERTAVKGGVTLKGTSANLSYNKNTIKRLQVLVGDILENDPNIFDNEDGQFKLLSLPELQALLTKVVIRFDNNPNYYTKSDYSHLIWYLCQSLGYNISNQTCIDKRLIEIQQQIDHLKQLVESQKYTIKKVHATYEDFESYIEACDDSVIGTLFLVTGGDRSGSYIVKTKQPLEIVNLSSGLSTVVVFDEITDKGVAYVEDGKLFIADMRSKWETNF